MDTTPEEAAQVVALLQQGLSQRAVAAQLHLSQSAVSRVYRRFQETGAFNRRPRTGRHRCTSERDDRFIVSTSLRNRHLTGVDVQQELRRVRQVAVSEWTVRRRLKEANLTPKRPASGPKLTAGHRQARLQFAREHLDWSIAQWRSVLFTDECRVCLHGSDRRGRVYRRPGERFAQCCFAETVAYGGGSCMMWAGISLEGKTALVFVPGGGRGGGLTADRYITDILLGHVVPYAEFVGEDFVLMHDNARCHTARVSRQFLREKELRTMDWPALSPDLNPIEHLWDELKRRVRARNPVPASVDELKTALLEEWDGIPQETVKKLIRSMRNRLQARNPSVGDKFASRAGQKGICSQLWPAEDLPFTEAGLVPDVLFNPHGFPSRMTIAMMLECMAGKSAPLHGQVHDATPFRFNEQDTAVDHFGRLLEAGGYNYYGTERMYSGADGREMVADIFFGVIHYQRLRHMVSDKWQVRTTGAVDALTRQPVKGRRRGGGVRLGEMERDALISHGASFVLQDRLLHCSDKTEATICTSCGSLLGPLISCAAGACRLCGAAAARQLAIPYIFKFFVTQLAAVNINVRIHCEGQAAITA
ncbi:unnamed protein product [Plutella xylostella]|uniref:DNA-directed RNA polymerase n=1 Tax=Plutella xylostella TaxID=51655 RepID=A0A8S4ETD5_PLUXY|nr:unnamed protein product [Plutella xylostella]